MLFVLSLFGYPIDGLTQSTVMAVQGFLRDNKFLMTGAAEVAFVVALLVWACAACQALQAGIKHIHDDIRPLLPQRLGGHLARVCGPGTATTAESPAVALRRGRQQILVVALHERVHPSAVHVPDQDLHGATASRARPLDGTT